MSNRLQSLDFLRGSCILWMLFQHITLWLANANALVMLDLIVNIFDGFGSGAFLFVSGLGIALSHRSKKQKVVNKKGFFYKRLRLNYFLKAGLLLALSFGFNLFIYFVVSNLDATVIWIWFILQTLPISMILAWPLLNSNKYLKVISAIGCLVLYQILIGLLYPFKNQYSNPLFIVQFILFNGDHLSPLLGFFPFFIIGAFFGDIIYENSIHDKTKLKNSAFINQKVLPLLLSGIFLIIIAILIIPPGIITVPSSSFLFSFRSVSWLLYSIGILLTTFSLLLIIEKSGLFKIKEKYRFVYYFSYYSLSVFLLHYIFDIFFFPSLDLWLILILWSLIVFGMGLVMKGIHILIGKHFSLKHQLGVVANRITKSIYKEEISQIPVDIKEFPIIKQTESQKKAI